MLSEQLSVNPPNIRNLNLVYTCEWGCPGFIPEPEFQPSELPIWMPLVGPTTSGFSLIGPNDARIGVTQQVIEGILCNRKVDCCRLIELSLTSDGVHGNPAK